MRNRALKVVLIISIILCPSSLADYPDDVLINLSSAFKYAISEKNIWIGEGNALSLYSTDGDFRWSIPQYNVEHIAAYGNKVYIQYYVDNKTYIQERSSDFTDEHYEWKLPTNTRILQMEVLANHIYFLAENMSIHRDHNDDQHSMYSSSFFILDKLTGSVEPFSIIGREKSSFLSFSVSDNLIIAIDDTYGELITVDAFNGECLSICPIIPLKYIYYDETSSSVFGLYTDSYGSCIIKVDVSSGNYSVIQMLNREDTFAGIRGNSNSLYVENVSSGHLIAIGIHEYTGSIYSDSIKVANSIDSPTNPRVIKAIELFNKNYPDYEIVFCNIGDTPALANAITNGLSEIDIISIQENSGIHSKALFKANSLSNLYHYPDITTALSEWINLDGIFTIENKRFGVPQAIMPYFWQINEELFSDLDLHLPTHNWTWDDFFNLCVEVERINAKSGSHHYVLADSTWPYIMAQYTSNNVDFTLENDNTDKSTLREITLKWKAIFDMGVILVAPEIPYLNDMPENTLIRVSLGDYTLLEGNQFIMPPTLPEATSFPTQTITLSINATSKRADIAAKFLYFYLTPEVVALDTSIHNGRLLIDSKYYEEAGTFDSFTLASEENIQYWFDILENGIQETYIGVESSFYAVEQLNLFLNGIIEMDEYLQIYEYRSTH